MHAQERFLPLELDTAAAELDYLAGPRGVGVQGVILDCPAVGAAWLRSHGWCGPPSRCQDMDDIASLLQVLRKASTRGGELEVHDRSWRRIAPERLRMHFVLVTISVRTYCLQSLFPGLPTHAHHHLQTPPFKTACLCHLRRQGTRPRLQAAAGAVGAATGQLKDGGWLGSSRRLFGLPGWEAAASAAMLLCISASAAGVGAWLWRRRRDRLKRCGAVVLQSMCA